MTVATVRDLLPAVDVAQASYHLAALHAGAPGFLCLSLLGNDRRERHGFTATTELTATSDVVTSAEALQEVVNDRWNVYTACSTFREPPEKGRGSRSDVASVPGVWADLDVKPGVEGYFQTEAECEVFVRRLLTPTLEIASGSGGRHLYWLLRPDERLAGNDGQKLLTAWLDFLRQEAAGYVVENVHDTTRILRLAGTVRWPKKGLDVVMTPRQVELRRVGPRYHVGELGTLALAAHEQAKAARDEARRQRGVAEQYQLSQLNDLGVDPNLYLHAQRRFNVEQDWAALLLATGWTLFSDQRDGAARCRYWTRPGKSTSDGKSASTDFVSDDGTLATRMTIYTNDQALHDLWQNVGETDSHGLCSKWHYAVTRLFAGDEAALYVACAKTGKLEEL